MAPPRRVHFLEQLYYHVALPRNVPGQEDRNLRHINEALLERLIDATSQLLPHISPQYQKHIRGLQDTLVACKALNVDGTIPRSAFLRELRNLDSKKWLVLHATAQNCALLAYNNTTESGKLQIAFEAFETSAVCDQVLASKNALLWNFPGCAAAVPYETFSEVSFQESLANFMEQASTEILVKFASTTIKASAPIPEIRDTSKPDLISGLLMTILEANGSVLPVNLLQKRVRDTVSFDNAHKPWRRSPFYLVVRVAIQRYLYHQEGAKVGMLHYKLLMCIMMSQFLEDAFRSLPFEAAFFLRQKLGRRLAKLESDIDNISQSSAKAFAFPFKAFDASFQQRLESIGHYLKKAWRFHKMEIERRVPLLRSQAFGEERNLLLTNSGRIIMGILNHKQSRSSIQACTPSELLKQYGLSAASVKPYMEAVDKYMLASQYHEDIVIPAKMSDLVDGPRCVDLSKTIQEFVGQIKASVDVYPDQLSHKLLHLMELWVLMDKAATRCFPLLLEFHPGFDPDILDSIQLLTLPELERVQQVQCYLFERSQSAGGRRRLTIFKDPSDDCFAARYYDNSEISEELLNMRDKIEENAAVACHAKEVEWEEKSDQHRDLVDRCSEKECKWDLTDSSMRYEHRWPCEWHTLQDAIKKIRITIHEHPLPSYEPATKATLFELRCPAVFAAYRDATFSILSSLCQSSVDRLKRISLIKDYSQLRSYANNTDCLVVLGSDKKAHLECHYANWNFPIQLEQVCRTCGLKPRYFDVQTQSWTNDVGEASFFHHFPVLLPKDSPYQGLSRNYAHWPSSNEVQASQAICPADVSTHEFLAWQNLLVGTHTRWLDLLRELGSSNLNFSADSTWAIVQRLILQVGPSSIVDSPYRDVHSALQDSSLCNKLLQQIRQRLEAIHRNWREPVQMDILISILLKLVSLSRDASILDQANESLSRARDICSTWRTDLWSTITEDPKSTTFAIWASLLCKRTMHLNQSLLLESDTLRQFLDSSIVLHYALTANFKAMPHNLRSGIVRDCLFTFSIRDFLKRAILASPQTFVAAVNGFWHFSESFGEKSDLAHVPDTSWVFFTLTSENQEVTHSIHYNYLYGTLLIDGQEMRALPAAYRCHTLYQQLFGNKNPNVFPSPLSGMSFTFAESVKDHRIHLGFRNEQLVIRASFLNETLEFIASQTFGVQTPYDLPESLLSDCFHWLNVYNGELHIRRKDPWVPKSGDWRIKGIKSGMGQAVRRLGSLQETVLLDPNCQIARNIAQIFHLFEKPHHIMVFASRDGGISAHLTRLDLTFFVNQKGLLECSRLGSSITQNQDAGTWYGLKSKIVVQSVANHRQKSILIPLGEFRVLRDGRHVSVEIENGTGFYLQFGINEVLGRIDCAPEPRLLYIRALLHAYTSNVFSDPLSQRTGSEEAVYLLKAGSYMPWKPLSDRDIQTLMEIAHLSPNRGYYPESLKCMETVAWQPDLPIEMQDERYRGLVAKILRRSSDLSRFSLEGSFKPKTKVPIIDPHLQARALSRTHAHKVKEDLVYESRDKRVQTVARNNVFELVASLSSWQSNLCGTPNIVHLLQDAVVVGGYDKVFQKCVLTDLLMTNLRADWGALSQKSLASSKQDRHNLMFVFGPLVFNSDVNMDLMRLIVSFAMVPGLKDLKPPQHPAYFHFRADGTPSSQYLISFMEKAIMPFREMGFKKRSQVVIAENLHQQSVRRSCEALAYSIQKQWPSPAIECEELTYIDPTFLNVNKALTFIKPEWTRLAQNHALALHLGEVQQILEKFIPKGDELTNSFTVCSETHCPLYLVRSRDRDDISLSQLFQTGMSFSQHIKMETSFNGHATINPTYASLVAMSGNVPRQAIVATERSNNVSGQQSLAYRLPKMTPSLSAQCPKLRKLRTLLNAFEDTKSFVQLRYKQELEASISALETRMGNTEATYSSSHLRITMEHINAAKTQAIDTLQKIRATLQAKSSQASWLQIVDLWPKMSVVDVLRELRSTSGTMYGQGTKESLVAFGLAISKWQRVLRIQDAQKRYRTQQELEEWVNEGHTNWDPLHQSDWLLLEIDGDILLREEQVEVALATIAPSSGTNSVLQLLMGKGKTSYILPMVAAVLANKVDLCRIVVPRPLLLQSAQVMQAKLGGLVDREIVHIPFSRKTPADSSLMHLYSKLHSRTKNRSGVILTLPDHILSFRLSGLQQLCDNHVGEATVLIKIQEWLEKHTRDVLDECDVSLAVRTQLIYPSGSQITVDGHPMRWQVVQYLLHLVKDFAPAVKGKYRRSIEIVKRGIDGFPLLYFLRRDAEEYLIELLVDTICKGQAASILPCAEYPLPVLEDLKAYISNPTIRSQVISRLADFFQGKPLLMKTAHLLRGLFVHRIFIAVLKKRWNVQYGLHPARAPIAVPFHAKGVPSPTAEWGHPDVAIALTCLSFYCQGLTMVQFKHAFDHLLKMDEPSIEYEKWFSKGADVPRELEDYGAINVEDAWQLNQLYQFVRSSSPLIDFYLNNFVFPKYAKTFRLKLQASGWNLFPPISVHNEGCRVTGFSGTNDSRHQLPMVVKQADLPHLAHTNAEVLYYLLAPRNQEYVLMANTNGVRWSELDLLDRLANPFKFPNANFRPTEKIRIIIDAGAQVLEHSNFAFAKAWLDRDTDAAAAIYFDEGHQAWALYRSGKKIPFLASPFTDHLDRCVVYLDENHCRGTDLKFPHSAKAALTLGQYLTKDALVQAAMRLRLLGRTQSVAFYSPLEVHQGIIDRLRKDDTYRPKSDDVLQWVIGQTCDAIEQLDPSYLAQMSQYLIQEQARIDYREFLTDEQARTSFLDITHVAESLSLKQLYEPKSQRNTARTEPVSWHPSLQPFVKELLHRKQYFQDRGTAVHSSALEEVEIEQEREAEMEIQTEIENIREIQKPPLFAALPIQKLHKDIEHFALTGFLPAGSDACQPMFSVLGRTALGLKHGVSTSMKSRLWISTQFNRTVDVYQSHDNYIRSCHWLMWSEATERALIVSPEEANAIIPILREKEEQQAGGTVHLIMYAAPTTRRMLQFNRLDYYAIPPLPASFKAPDWLRIELGIFSGRLHLEWDEYFALLGYLGLNRDLSVDSQNSAFVKKPLAFMHEWVALRRSGQDFEHTPMGFVTAGKPLTENHPFFRALGQGDGDADHRPQIACVTSGRAEVGQEEDNFEDDEDEFVPAVAGPVDDSESEEEAHLSDEDAEFFDVEEDLE